MGFIDIRLFTYWVGFGEFAHSDTMLWIGA